MVIPSYILFRLMKTPQICRTCRALHICKQRQPTLEVSFRQRRNFKFPDHQQDFLRPFNPQTISKNLIVLIKHMYIKPDRIFSSSFGWRWKSPCYLTNDYLPTLDPATVGLKLCHWFRWYPNQSKINSIRHL